MPERSDPDAAGCATATVVAVHRSPGHTFSKAPATAVALVAGCGVRGDAHAGARVRHRSRVRADPDQPNLRQVHLIQRELLDELGSAGFAVAPGELGENITTEGLDLLGLPTGAVLLLGPDALVVLTGLRNPCHQIDDHAPGLLAQVRRRDDSGAVVRRAGVMGVVVRSGTVAPGDPIVVASPPLPHHPLAPV